MRGIIFLFMVVVFVVSAQRVFRAGIAEAVAESSVASETSNPVLKLPIEKHSEVIRRTFFLETKQFDLPIDVYRSELSEKAESQRVVFYFGPPPDGSSEYPDFSELLSGVDFHGLFVVLNGDFDGQHAQKFIVRNRVNRSVAQIESGVNANNGFDDFSHLLFEKIASAGWLVDEKNLGIILTGFGSGAETINKIGQTHSRVLKARAYAVGVFNGQFVSGISGVEKIINESPIGFKTYAVVTKSFEDQLKPFVNISDSAESDSRISLESVFETLNDGSIANNQVVSTCLPRFLKHLSVDPFISFRCRSAK